MDGAAVSVVAGTVHRETLSATDAVATKLEDLQFTFGEGVCVEAATSGRPVLVPDLHDALLTSRWPIFAAGRCSRCRCSWGRSTSEFSPSTAARRVP